MRRIRRFPLARSLMLLPMAAALAGGLWAGQHFARATTDTSCGVQSAPFGETGSTLDTSTQTGNGGTRTGISFDSVSGSLQLAQTAGNLSLTSGSGITSWINLSAAGDFDND